MTTLLKDFTQSDWDAFAGCESEYPKVWYGDQFSVVVDGNSVSLHYGEDGLEATAVTFDDCYQAQSVAEAFASHDDTFRWAMVRLFNQAL